MTASAYIAALAASALSVITLMSCIVMVPMVYQKVSSVRMMVENDMDEFNVSALGLRFSKLPGWIYGLFFFLGPGQRSLERDLVLERQGSPSREPSHP